MRTYCSLYKIDIVLILIISILFGLGIHTIPLSISLSIFSAFVLFTILYVIRLKESNCFTVSDGSLIIYNPLKLWRSIKEFNYNQITEITVIKLSTRYNEDRLLVHCTTGKIAKFHFRGINEMKIDAMLEELSKMGFPITYLKGHFRDPEKITFNYKKINEC